MVNLNFDKIGKQLAKISSKESATNNKVVSVNADEDADDLITKTYSKITLKNGVFQPIADPNTERVICYCTGASGCGKSTFCYRWCAELKKRKKDTKFFLISSLNEDSSIDQLGDSLFRVKVDEELLVNPIDISEFPKGSVLIFDDIDVIANKKIRDVIYILLNQVLEVGRHYSHHCLVTNHMPTSGHQTKRALNEAHQIIWYPHSGTSHGMKYLLQNYCGLSKDEITWAKNQKSRWCCYYKNYPPVLCSEKEIRLLSSDE